MPRVCNGEQALTAVSHSSQTFGGSLSVVLFCADTKLETWHPLALPRVYRTFLRRL